MKLLDLFAGVGVGIGARNAGFEDFGVEIDRDSRETRRLNGLRTVAADVWDVESVPNEGYDVLWASPPCQTFSSANPHVNGKSELDKALDFLNSGWDFEVESLRDLTHEVFSDERSALVLTPLAYAKRFNPRAIVLEQVPSVLRLWNALAPYFEGMGYEVWTGMVDSSEFGVPQSRRRAYLTACKGARVVPKGRGEVVNMAQALGWGITDRPSPTVTSKEGATNSASGTQKVYINAIERGAFIFRPDGSDEPSKVAKNGIGSMYPPGRINTKVEDNKVLQGFPREMEFSGSRQSQQLQIGNAVPPPVAQQILEQIANEWEEDLLGG